METFAGRKKANETSLLSLENCEHKVVIDMKTHKAHCMKCNCRWKKVSLILEGYLAKGEKDE